MLPVEASGIVCALGDRAGRYAGCTAHRSARRSYWRRRFFCRATLNLAEVQFTISFQWDFVSVPASQLSCPRETRVILETPDVAVR